MERKIGVKPGQVVFLDHPPTGFTLEAPTTTRMPKLAAITLTFQTDAAALVKRLPTLIAHTEQAGMIWICWPKKAARKLGYDTDLDDSIVRRSGLEAGLVDVKVCAVDEIWSGLKFVRRVADRIPG